jgi:hypothetical protein
MQKHGNRNYHLTQGFESLTVLQKSAATIFPKEFVKLPTLVGQT